MPPSEAQRKKAWKPKVKTGCITCRIRRVKCDEAKPQCNRCTSTGRRCDGYKPVPQPGQVVLRKSQSPTLLFEPFDFASENDRERQSFQFFQMYTAPEFSGFFQSKFWTQDILQASHLHPAIWHSIVGLGALHKKFIGCEVPVVPDNANDQELRFALEQCNLAIQEIVRNAKDTSNMDKVTAMTACILFNSFACLQGHQKSAMEHLRGGLKLLKEFDEEEGHGAVIAPHPVSLTPLRAMFTILDIQARGLLSEEQLEHWETRPKSDVDLFPTYFHSPEHARSYLEELLNQVLNFLQRFSLEYDLPNGIATRAELEPWRIEFETFLFRHKLASRLLDELMERPWDPDDKHKDATCTALKLSRAQTGIFLKTFNLEPRRSEMCWDGLEEESEELLELATRLLKAIPTATSEDEIPDISRCKAEATCQRRLTRPVFSSSFGLVAALWNVAARCRDPRTRRKAMMLLLDYPRREGVWDGVLAGRIAWEVIMLEEEAAIEEFTAANPGVHFSVQAASDIPDHHRIRATELTFHAERKADVVFLTVGQWSRGERGFSKKIEW